jgi:dihydropyrimidinase
VERKPFPPVAAALSKWKEITAPRRVVRDPANMPAGV